MRATAHQESPIWDEEPARAIRQLKEQEGMAAEEANRWVQQCKQLKALGEARRLEISNRLAAAGKTAHPPKTSRPYALEARDTNDDMVIFRHRAHPFIRWVHTLSKLIQGN